jgi:uncharacterized protein
LTHMRTIVATPARLLFRVLAALACGLVAAAPLGALRAGAQPAAKTAGEKTTDEKTANEKAASPKIKIAFAGDSLVDNYWSGITRVIAANACLKTSVELGRFARNGTGLTRGDKLYWPREVRKIGETFKPDLFVLSVGINDRQFIIDGEGARTAWGAPDWTDKYRAQVLAFLKGAVASKAVVLLVGLPVMRDSTDNADAQEKNKIFVETVAAVAAGGASDVAYVEPWTLKPSGPDPFASYGPDRNGRMMQIRTADGQHFTVAGEDLAAAYLYPKIVTAFAHKGVRLGGACESADKAGADKAIGDKASADKASADQPGDEKGKDH